MNQRYGGTNDQKCLEGLQNPALKAKLSRSMRTRIIIIRPTSDALAFGGCYE